MQLGTINEYMSTSEFKLGHSLRAKFDEGELDDEFSELEFGELFLVIKEILKWCVTDST
jgi:hypothetical protein